MLQVCDTICGGQGILSTNFISQRKKFQLQVVTPYHLWHAILKYSRVYFDLLYNL